MRTVPVGGLLQIPGRWLARVPRPQGEAGQAGREADGLCPPGGERLAIQKREARGLLAGLWELPNVLGDLDDRAALEQAAAWGVEPVTLEKSVRQDHVFTHVRWEMVCYHFTCRGISSEFEWAGEAALEQDVALPTAFRKFL